MAWSTSLSCCKGELIAANELGPYCCCHPLMKELYALYKRTGITPS